MEMLFGSKKAEFIYVAKIETAINNNKIIFVPGTGTFYQAAVASHTCTSENNAAFTIAI
jgi:hypothetical protein